ncbi:MAG: hypothetical protein EOP56_02875 [Sphingobacteriales bacterium]|nr:MAG: hypothetical protein EOP56_02875 [Sphingobacteriales bacterium]
MTEVLEFFKTLKRRKAILTIVPIVTIVIALLLVRQLPDKYISKSRLSTGIADRSQQLLLEDNPYQHESRVNQEFNNLIETIQLNEILDKVSYTLMLHDLQAETPYRKPSKMVKKLTATERSALVAMLNNKLQKRQGSSAISDIKFYELLNSMGYDHASIKKNLKVYRQNNSDFIQMEFESDNANLSAYVLNAISSTFIGYYTSVVSQNKRQAVQYLDSLLKQKQNTLLVSLDALNQYKIKNNIVDLEEQTRTLYSQMADVAARKGMAQKEAIAYSAALNTVNRKFQPGSNGMLDNKLASLNQDIVQTKEELQSLNDAYIKSDFDSKYKVKMDSVQRRLQSQIIRQSEVASYDPSSTRENLANQKLNLEVSNAMAKNSLGTYDQEIGRLNAGLSKIAPNAANVDALKNAVSIAEKEYQEILTKYNEAVMAASFTLPIKQIERAAAPEAEPNMKMVIVALSGVMSLIFSVLVLFIMFYFDRSIYTVSQLELVTDAPILGALNVMKLGTTDLKQLWNPHNSDPNSQMFKNLMRAVRYEVENDLQNSQIIAVTSFSERAGKTFFTKSLAYSLTKINKRVLIIDGNFMNPDLSNNSNGQSQFLETFLLGSGDEQVNDSTAIAVIGNKGGDNSILEVTDPETVHRTMDQLKSMYDVIIIETNALETINKAKAKEWMMFTDKVIAVVEAGQPFDKEMHHELRYLKGMGSKFAGLVLNKVPGFQQEEEAKKSFFKKFKAGAKFKMNNKYKAA